MKAGLHVSTLLSHLQALVGVDPYKYLALFPYYTLYLILLTFTIVVFD